MVVGVDEDVVVVVSGRVVVVVVVLEVVVVVVGGGPDETTMLTELPGGTDAPVDGLDEITTLAATVVDVW